MNESAATDQSVVTIPYSFRGREGERMRSDIRLILTGEPKPVVIFAHGFKGFKDWGPFPTICEHIARAGFVTISINFSHNGVGSAFEEFSELDRFANNTITRELEELEDVIGWIASPANDIPISLEEFDQDTIGLFGHSRGGGIVMLAGRRSSQVRAVATWAPVSTFDRWTDRQKAKWREEGHMDTLNMRTNQVMRMGMDMLMDIESGKEQLDVLQAARDMRQLEKPLLIVSGSQDLTVPPREAEQIHAAAGEYSWLEMIPQTGHTFDSGHPFNGEIPVPLQEAMRLTTQFFHRVLIDREIVRPA